MRGPRSHRTGSFVTDYSLVMLLLAGLLGLVVRTGAAFADGGEAGLVIQNGDGTIDTYCVAFSGDGITGDRLLAQAGVTVVSWGGLVCAIGESEGCFQPNSVSSCTCQCKGGADCTYWAFFTQRYGQAWVYASIGYQGQKAKDGDLQGWKWGKGGLQSAPAPQAITFEQVCGHPPQAAGGGSAATVTTSPGGPSPAVGSDATPADASPGVAVGQPSTALAGSPSPSFAAATGEKLVTIVPGGATPPLASSPAREDTEDKRGSGGLVGFGIVALVLILGVVAASAWRYRRDRQG
ncbi:MAG: hypothetical protein HY875_06830 [Chloroflexi bacterium]|nr:hypothetical protein [Chloroflexota bacterium]